MSLEEVQARLAELEFWVSCSYRKNGSKPRAERDHGAPGNASALQKNKTRTVDGIPKVSPSARGKPRFRATVAPSASVLTQQTPSNDATTVRSLLARLRDEEHQRSAERGALQLQVQKEKGRAQKAERAAHLAEERLDYRVKEVRHLRAALKQRDVVVQTLQERMKELEMGVASAEALRDAQGMTLPLLSNMPEIASDSYLPKYAGEKEEAKLELKEATRELEAMRAAALEQTNAMKETLAHEQQQTRKAHQRAKHAEHETSRLEKVLEEEKEAQAKSVHEYNQLMGHALRQRAGMIKLVSTGRMLSNDIVTADISESASPFSCQTTPVLSTSDGMLSDN